MALQEATVINDGHNIAVRNWSSRHHVQYPYLFWVHHLNAVYHPPFLSTDRDRSAVYRKNLDYTYPSVFFNSFKSIKTVAWFSQIPESVRRRYAVDYQYPSFFMESYKSINTIPWFSYFHANSLNVANRKLSRSRYSSYQSFSANPKLGAKTRPIKEC